MYDRQTIKLKETRRLVKWISENYDDWQGIVELNVRRTPNEYLYYFNKLIEEQFYEVLVLFIFRNQDTIGIYPFLETLGLQQMSENWNITMLEKFRSYILQEVEASNVRREKSTEKTTNRKEE